MNIQDLTSRSEEVAELLKAMANSHRLLILCELNKGERTVSALEAVVPLSQSALSQHLAKLRDYGIVSTRREAQSIYYWPILVSQASSVRSTNSSARLRNQNSKGESK